MNLQVTAESRAANTEIELTTAAVVSVPQRCNTRVRMDPRDAADELEKTIERYNDAWNAQDVESILSFHAPGMVFENHTAGDRVEGDAVGPHIAGIFERTPDLRFTGRRLYVRDGLVVSEWTATATNRAGQRVEWDGIDVFPFENGLILRKDVYSSSHDPRVLDD
jgi:ketosteroid isomerase-like protein